MDDVDLAAERIEAFNKVALEAARSVQPAKPSTGFCCDCGDPIEPASIKALPHAKDCAICAADAEVIAKLNAKRGPR